MDEIHGLNFRTCFMENGKSLLDEKLWNKYPLRSQSFKFPSYKFLYGEWIEVETDYNWQNSWNQFTLVKAQLMRRHQNTVV